MVNKYLVLILLVICLVTPVFAVPTTSAATLVGENTAFLEMTGGTNPMFFEYGQKNGSLTWVTPNSSAPNYTVYGSPLLGGTTFYFRACDMTGCGNQLSFTTDPLTPQPQTTFGAGIDNITRSQFDIMVLAKESIGGYFWVAPGNLSVVIWGLLFFAIYIGLWIRERDVLVPTILGLISGTFIMWGDTGLGLGIAPEFVSIAQGIAYASLAGIILGFIKRS